MKKILCLLLSAAFLACTDEDHISVSKPVITEETLLNRGSDIYDIDIPGNADWTVISNPYWAAPMAFEGNAGTAIELFVETNDADAARRDSLVVKLADGGTVCIPIRQHGLATVGVNDDDITISANALKKTKGVGYGVNVIEQATAVGMKYNVKSTPFHLSNLKQVIDAMGWKDAIVDEPVYSSRYESVTGNTTGAIANQLAVNAGIEVGIKAFKFGVEAGYSKASDNSKKTSYAMLEMQHIVGSRYFRAGLMRYLAEHEDLYRDSIKTREPNDTPSVFAQTFVDIVKILKDDPGNISAMKDLITFYGTHVICHGTLGGELKVSMQMEEDNSSESSNIHAALSLSSKLISGDASVDLKGADKSVSDNTKLSLRSYGGKNKFTLNPNSTFQSFSDEVRDKSKMDGWVSQIKDGTSLALIDMQTIPIWDLMPTEELRDSLRNYVVGPYQRSLYGDDFKPDLYEVKGFDVTNNAPGYGSIYLPDVELQIDMERRIVPELSTDELSTVIYSGPKDSVDRNRGFFVGSLTRKPCKFRREKNGTFTTEEFDRLDTNNIIDVLFVDVSGDITIAPKGLTDLYQVYTVANWKHDLSMLTSDWTFKDNITVTGTTDHCIHIADGTTLTLDNVTVNNQIVCDGNATIILKDGTKNSVISPKDSKAGIQVGTTGKTLTISGNGELETQGGKNVPGIGGSGSKCGNITITGGVITAKAGTGAGSPGIGGSWGHPCGNITITNGTVTAVGSNNGPGIGASAKSSCGNIEISGGTVTATGTFCAAGIGTGWEGKCADITISGGTVTATGGGRAAGIGSGCSASCGNITITKGVQAVKATCGKGDTCVPIGAGDNSTCGTITIAEGASVTQKDPNIVDVTNLNSTIVVDRNMTITGRTNQPVQVLLECKLTLANATISNQIKCQNGQIMLRESTFNFVEGGIVGEGELVISGNGALIVSAPEKTSAIGSNEGSIVIRGGYIEAKGGADAAAIGSAYKGKCKSIIISDGTVKAQGGKSAAGIGSGMWGTCGNIMISGGTVEAVGGLYGSGIGSGSSATCGKIVISGGNVKAVTEQNAAAIGTGGVGHGQDIEITGGSIVAECAENGPGIGYGFDSREWGDITISGGSVKAVGGRNSAGIGSGLASNCNDITIKKSVKEIYAKRGENAQSIGAGYNAKCGIVTIEEGANVTQE